VSGEFLERRDETMSIKGGRRSAGRPRGAISLSTRAVLEAAQSGGEMPIAYMLRIMRDENASSARRDEMAKAAAAYLHTKLSLVSEDEAQDLAPAAEAETSEGALDNQ
jgi:hypothetical protein